MSTYSIHPNDADFTILVYCTTGYILIMQKRTIEAYWLPLQYTHIMQWRHYWGIMNKLNIPKVCRNEELRYNDFLSLVYPYDAMETLLRYNEHLQYTRMMQWRHYWGIMNTRLKYPDYGKTSILRYIDQHNIPHWRNRHHTILRYFHPCACNWLLKLM